MENHRRVGFCSNSSDRNPAFAIFLGGFTQIIVSQREVMKVFVAYSSKFGSTSRIGEFIAEKLD